MRTFFAPELEVNASIPITNVTSATATNGSAVDISPYMHNLAITVHSTVATADDTIDFTVQMSEDGSTGWTALTAADLIDADGTPATFTQITDASTVLIETLYVRLSGTVNRYLRVVGTTAGAAAIDVTFGATISGLLRYSDDN